MSSFVAMQEAQEHLPEWMERVERGEEIVIEREGRGTVRLVAVVEAPAFAGKRMFGENFLGITHLEPGWEDDLPLDMFEAGCLWLTTKALNTRLIQLSRKEAQIYVPTHPP